MNNIALKKITAQQEAMRTEVIDNSNRAQSAFALAEMALEHSGDGSYAAATLLLAMENGNPFDFQLLLKFDSTNRAHADLVIMGYKPHELWPSKWMDGIGKNGVHVMTSLAEKWENPKLTSPTGKQLDAIDFNA